MIKKKWKFNDSENTAVLSIREVVFNKNPILVVQL